MRVIDRPIGTTTIYQEFPFLLIKDTEQLFNIMSTHVGYEVLVLKRVVDPNSFQPMIDMVLFRRIDNTETKTTYIRLPLEIQQIGSMKYTISNNKIEVIP